MATKSWDSSYEDLLDLVDLPSLECRRLETRLCLLYKIIHKLCYFDDGIFIPSTSLTHHAPHNLVLNRPFAHTNSYNNLCFLVYIKTCMHVVRGHLWKDVSYRMQIFIDTSSELNAKKSTANCFGTSTNAKKS